MRNMKPISLREQQLLAVDILSYVADICEKNNIRYSLGGGTLIGAVRHKGFIPWDDDIDLYFTREEYQKFVEIWQKQEHSRYQLELAEEMNTIGTGCVTKIYDKQTRIIEQSGDSRGVFIDLFTFEPVPENISQVVNIIHHYKNLYSKYNKFSRKVRKPYKYLFLIPLLIYFRNRAFIPMLEYIKQLSVNYAGSTNSAMVMYFYHDFEKACIPTQDLIQTQYLEFEGEQYQVMANYHEHLTMYYGDYMQLPPENERVNHTKKAYRLND
ncbi:hypothetical protein A4G18_03705 [Pasteurellaceae bacterium Pebbles2]|nr:hypothetical protein [Pasteurellaceae bacterium Pebbles2]